MLAKGGVIPAGWVHTDRTGGPEDAARLLEEDGVTVLKDDNGQYYAHPRHYVDWEELRRRMTEQAGDQPAA